MIPLNEQTDRVLMRLCESSRDADHLLPLLYDELRSIATRKLKRERPDHTLQPTALVNEVFVRMQALREVPFRSRAHFCGVAAHVMRRVLVDHARKRNAAKRAPGERVMVTLDEFAESQAASGDFDLIDLSDALDELSELNPRHAQVVELRFFAGLTVNEAAAALAVQPRWHAMRIRAPLVRGRCRTA